MDLQCRKACASRHCFHAAHATGRACVGQHSCADTDSALPISAVKVASPSSAARQSESLPLSWQVSLPAPAASQQSSVQISARPPFYPEVVQESKRNESVTIGKTQASADIPGFSCHQRPRGSAPRPPQRGTYADPSVCLSYLRLKSSILYTMSTRAASGPRSTRQYGHTPYIYRTAPKLKVTQPGWVVTDLMSYCCTQSCTHTTSRMQRRGAASASAVRPSSPAV